MFLGPQLTSFFGRIDTAAVLSPGAETECP